MLHACGWLEGGLVSSYEKFVLDADQLGVLHSLAEGIDLSENGQAMDAMREVGPGGHFLGCAHTQANFKNAFWRTAGARLPAVRDLGRGRRARFGAARQCAGAASCSPTTRRRRSIRGSRRRCRTSSTGARPRSRTPSRRDAGRRRGLAGQFLEPVARPRHASGLGHEAFASDAPSSISATMSRQRWAIGERRRPRVDSSM